MCSRAQTVIEVVTVDATAGRCGEVTFVVIEDHSGPVYRPGDMPLPAATEAEKEDEEAIRGDTTWSLIDSEWKRRIGTAVQWMDCWDESVEEALLIFDDVEGPVVPGDRFTVSCDWDGERFAPAVVTRLKPRPSAAA